MYFSFSIVTERESRERDRYGYVYVCLIRNYFIILEVYSSHDTVFFFFFSRYFRTFIENINQIH